MKKRHTIMKPLMTFKNIVSNLYFHYSRCFKFFLRCVQGSLDFNKPFPTYSKSAADNFDNIVAKGLLSMSNISLCHNVLKSRLWQRHQKSSVCGKGLNKASGKTTMPQSFAVTRMQDYFRRRFILKG